MHRGESGFGAVADLAHLARAPVLYSGGSGFNARSRLGKENGNGITGKEEKAPGTPGTTPEARKARRAAEATGNSLWQEKEVTGMHTSAAG